LRVVPAGSLTPEAVEVDSAAEAVVLAAEVSTAAAVVAMVTEAAKVVWMEEVCCTATLTPETTREAEAEVDLALQADFVLELEEDLALHADLDLELVGTVELLNGAEVTTGAEVVTAEDETATAATWAELDEATTAAAELEATPAAVVYGMSKY
jgi:squalene cyclase